MNQNEDFMEFIKSWKTPGDNLDQKTKAKVYNLYKKEQQYLYLKMILIHLVAGGATLALCPQFGWNPFGVSDFLTHFFMSFGTWACGLFCGGLFIGAGTLFKMVLMKKGNLLIYHHQFMRNSLILCSFFTILLMIFGLESASGTAFYSLSFVFFWLLGGWLVEFISTSLRFFILRDQ